jgi:hypothetical protein
LPLGRLSWISQAQGWTRRLPEVPPLQSMSWVRLLIFLTGVDNYCCCEARLDSCGVPRNRSPVTWVNRFNVPSAHVSFLPVSLYYPFTAQLEGPLSILVNAFCIGTSCLPSGRRHSPQAAGFQQTNRRCVEPVISLLFCISYLSCFN